MGEDDSAFPRFLCVYLYQPAADYRLLLSCVNKVVGLYEDAEIENSIIDSLIIRSSE